MIRASWIHEPLHFSCCRKRVSFDQTSKWQIVHLSQFCSWFCFGTFRTFVSFLITSVTLKNFLLYRGLLCTHWTPISAIENLPWPGTSAIPYNTQQPLDHCQHLQCIHRRWNHSEALFEQEETPLLRLLLIHVGLSRPESITGLNRTLHAVTRMSSILHLM